MALLGFQTALGRLVRAPKPNDSKELDLSPGEHTLLTRLMDSPGLRFTIGVQRSWCEGRAARAARMTLSTLPPEQRQQLLNEWLSTGGGTNSFFASEAEAFLGFIAPRLPDPSHALTLCRVEQAVYRANSAAATFRPPDLSTLRDPDALLCVGRYASLVWFSAEPHRVFLALERGEPLPSFSKPSFPILFAPGLAGLFRQANNEEVVLWQVLARPVKLQSLLQGLYSRETIEALVASGAVELTEE